MAAPHVHVPFDKVRDYADFIRAHRLNLEIYFSSHCLDTLRSAEIQVLQSLLDHSPSLSFHGPFMDLSPGAVDSMVRKATVQRFMKVLEVADVLRPLCIVFHSGYEKWKYALKIEPWLSGSIETWSLVNEKATSLGVKVAVENIFEDDPLNLRLLVEALGSTNFGICFDTGHFNLFSRSPLEEWLKQLGPYLHELHLHDNDGSADSHSPIGDGTFDFDRLFRAPMPTDLIFTIEAHSPEKVLTSLERIRKYLPL
jgi:sugar phosphate isomerase/epimerase